MKKLLLLIPLLLLIGCATLDHGADPVEVRAEQTISGASDTMDLFVTIENDWREYCKKKLPEVHDAAEWLRAKQPDGLPRGLSMVSSANKARLAYKKNRTPENKANLLTAIATLQTASREAESQLANFNSSTNHH